MSDPLEAIRKDMQQEPPQEFVRGQGHHFWLLLVLIVLVGESDLSVLHSEEPVIGNGHSMRVAAQVIQNGLLDRSVAQGIVSLKGVRRSGDRAGNWLTREQARDLLAQPESDSMEGKRDRAILAVLLGCALRRSELAALHCGHTQQRDGRWVFVDLVGKGKRIRTVPIPPFVKVAIDAWTAAAG